MNENCFRSFSLDQFWVLHGKFLCDSRDWAIFGRYNLRFASVKLDCLVHKVWFKLTVDFLDIFPRTLITILRTKMYEK